MEPESDGKRDVQLAGRRARLTRWLDTGFGPMAYEFDATHSAQDIAQRWSSLETGGRTEDIVRVAGRLILVRRHGGLDFLVLRDRTGTVQLFVDREVVGAELFSALHLLDRGDWIGVNGTVMRTDRGELSVAVSAVVLLGKALRPPPDKDKGLTDVEVRYRRRYLDLMTNTRTRRIFEIRRLTLESIRSHLAEHGYWEVEGPILQSIQGGATARPFITHHNALDIDMYLRIALELHLKRLVVGGMERVFELSRVFRNEGIDVRHNPEFTMLEGYQAYADYHQMMDLVEGMVVAAARSALGDNLVVRVGDHSVDLSPPWPRITMSELIEQRLDSRMDPTMPVAEARAVLDRHGVEWETDWGSGKLMKALVDDRVQHDVVEPIFCVDYPEEVSPLARKHRTRPGYVERFELMVAGFELCNAYSEQNDPDRQLAAFEDEARAKAQGDPEAGDIDYDYVRALEYGMPCTGGFGIGIDRLVMLLSEADNIREVILFPTMRPEAGVTGPTVPPSGGSGLGRIQSPSGGAAASPAPAAVATAAPPLGAVTRNVDHLFERRRTNRTLHWLGALAGLGGALMLLTLLPVFHSTLHTVGDPIGPVWFTVTGHLLTMLVGLGLLFLATQVARGKHTAWLISVILYGIGIVTSILKGPHPISAAYCAALFALLLGNRRLFQARSDPPSLRRLLWLVPVYVVAVFGYGFASLIIKRDQLSPPLTFVGGLQTIAFGLVGVGGPYTYHEDFFADYFPKALLLLGVVGVVGLAFLLFRPLRARRARGENDWAHARRLVHTYGSDTLAYFALRPDKSFFFASDGEAMIAYTYLSGYALAGGDPIGAPGSIDLVIDEFLGFCRQRSWRATFLAARDDELPRYTARGMRHFYLGDEAIIDCRTFALDGSSMKSVRAAVRRVERSYRFEIMRESQASTALVEALNAISEQWRGKAPERGFTMSLSRDVEGNGANPEFLLCVARDEKGVPGGFLRIVPAYGADFGYTLDLMRHRPDAPNGMTEFLIARTAVALGAEDISRLSMNFAMWGRLYEKDVSYSLSQRLAKRMVDVMNPFFQIKSLHDFNAKFAPMWLSRSLVFEEPPDLPRVGLLYAGAEGFLALPGIGELFVPKVVDQSAPPASAPAA